MWLKKQSNKNISFPLSNFFLKKKIDKIFRLFKTPYSAIINDYYSTSYILCLSKTLKKCSAVYKKNFQNFI
jgi:hypothetical protein